MNLKLSLFFTAALVAVVAISEGEAGRELENLRNQFRVLKFSNRAHPVRHSANSNAYASASSANAAAGATSASNGGRRYGSPYAYGPAQESHHQVSHNPALRYNTHGQNSVAASTASAGHGTSSASGYASAGEPSHEFDVYGYESGQHGHGHGRRHGHHYAPAYGYGHQYAPVYGHEQFATDHVHNQHGHGGHQHGGYQHGGYQHGGHQHGGRSRHGAGHRHQHPYAEPEVAHPTNYAQASRFPPVTSVHPPVPQVARDFYGGRTAGDSSVSTSVAAAGSVAAAAAAAASGGQGVTGGVSFGSHGPSGSSAAAVSSAGSHTGAHTAHSHHPVSQNDHLVETESSSEHYSKPESLDQFAAATGTLTQDNHGVVTSSYVRSTENEEEHEDGKENSDHHYKANSYGKTYDESHNENFDRDDEDIIHTPQLFRKTKRVVNYNKDLNKARRESGSSVLAQDKHSASYNKDKKKFKENVNQNFHAEGQGVLETGSSNENSSADEESEEHYDSRNLAGGFVGVDGVKHDQRPMFNPAAAAAASASSAGVSSATSAGGH